MTWSGVLLLGMLVAIPRLVVLVFFEEARRGG